MSEEEDIARLFGVPVEALAGARRHGLMKRLWHGLWALRVRREYERVAHRLDGFEAIVTRVHARTR